MTQGKDLSGAIASMAPCGDCGMPCSPNEYHPYAACLMFKACHNSETVKANLDAIRAPYWELLYAVAQKHPGETRHETALRYIRQAESLGRGEMAGMPLHRTLCMTPAHCSECDRIAAMTEHLPSKQVVGGSIPSGQATSPL